MARRDIADEVKSTLERRDGHWRRGTRNTSRLASIHSKLQTFLIMSEKLSYFFFLYIGLLEMTQLMRKLPIAPRLILRGSPGPTA